MIAANFGYLELLKYFIDKNVDIEVKDNANFTALLYSCKVFILVYLFVLVKLYYLLFLFDFQRLLINFSGLKWLWCCPLSCLQR